MYHYNLIEIHAEACSYNRKDDIEHKPLKTKQVIHLEASTFARMAQQHHHERLPSTLSNTLIVVSSDERQCHALEPKLNSDTAEQSSTTIYNTSGTSNIS